MFHPSPVTLPPATLAPHRLVGPSDMLSRPLPAPPKPWVGPLVAQVPASRSQFPSRLTGSLPPPLCPSRCSTATSFSSLSLSISHFPPPPVSTFSSPTTSRPPSLSFIKSRSSLPFSASRLSQATRNTTACFAEDAARIDAAEAMFEDEHRKRLTAGSEAFAEATTIGTEEDPRKAAIQAKANELVKSSIRSLLSRGLPHEECDTVLKKCDQICTYGGLELSVVLQEPLIDGKPPIYWAILNAPTTFSRSSEAAMNAIVLLLDACQPLRETTIASIRQACMLTSNNALLQHLFWFFPVLSPLSRSDVMLLSSTGGGDVVDVDETREGAFIARFQIRRFRLRMRVSKLIKVEFVTSDRIWTITFSVGTNDTADGRSENQWLLSFGLDDHSKPAWVDGDFIVLKRSPSLDRGNNYEPTFSLPLGHNCKFQPGPESAIKMRLDDGPMRPHLLHESLSLVDNDGTLHARFNVRPSQTRHSTSLPTLRIDYSDGASLKSSAQAVTPISTRSMPPRSLMSQTQDKRNRNAPDKGKKVYTSLRRGGR